MGNNMINPVHMWALLLLFFFVGVLWERGWVEFKIEQYEKKTGRKVNVLRKALGFRKK